MKHHGAKLSAAAVRAAKKPGLYGDGHNLYLQVSAFGTKAWIFRFWREGRERKMGLGALHTVSLAEARAEALEARKLVRKGIDPIDAKRAQRSRQRLEAAKAITFKECADAYIKANEASWKNEKHVAQWRSTFNETSRRGLKFPAATQAINDLPVAAIDTGLVLKALEPIWAKTPETASRVRGRIELVLDWAKVRGYRDGGENPARWRGHLQQALPARSKLSRGHHFALPYVETPRLLAELRAMPDAAARALEFTILTAARTGEAIGARWAEFDLAAKVWTIPASRMKAGREHRVPLSARVLEILAEAPGSRARGEEGDIVFVGVRPWEEGPLSNRAMRELVRRLRGKDVTVHGFRSTFRDWAAEQTSYPHELCEIALAHAVSDKTEAAYRRGDMMEKRRRLMGDWAAYCEKAPGRTENVVAIREAAQ